MASIKITPAKLNYTIIRGDDFADTVTIKEGGPPAVAVDVSTRTYTAQIRSTPDGDVVQAMSIDMTDAATGIVAYLIADADTADLDGAYVWDFQQATAGGVVRTLMGGSFVVLKDVTRAS
jgi:hypothetical protein